MEQARLTIPGLLFEIEATAMAQVSPLIPDAARGTNVWFQFRRPSR